MNILYDAKLTEAVVRQEIEKKERKGDLSLMEEYHKQVDPIYEIDDVIDREDEFDALYEKFFLNNLGYGKVIKVVFDEFPFLNDKISDVYVNMDLMREEANLMKKDSDDPSNLRKIKFKMRAEIFDDTNELKKALRHELMHVKDMLDDDYGYDTKVSAGLNTTEENFVRDRYKILWDVYIDSRLIKEGRETLESKEKRFAWFSGIYRKIPYPQKVVMFDNFWNKEKITHKEILDMATDMMKAVPLLGGDAADTDLEKAEIEKEKMSYWSGRPCPLCQFPTYKWADDIKLQDENAKKLQNAIKADFPKWTAEEGACERCAELYKFNLEEAESLAKQ
ncbi:MAG: hypothetical protein AAB197_06620 [Deltaproteobacteria bacterium]